MRQEQFGGETVYRVYERKRLRQMARKLGLRLVKFRGVGKRSEMASGGGPGNDRCQVVRIDARKHAVSE